MARKVLLPPSVKAGIPQDQPVPTGWSKVTYGDVLEVVERPAALKDDTKYQLVTAKRSRGGIVPRERLLGSQVLTKTQFYARSGDFLISRRQIIHGACGIVPDELDGAIVSNEYATLRNRSSLDIEFLSYLPHSTHFQQCCFHSSVGVDVEKMVFKLDQWLKHSFSLPPVPEQKKIAAILGSMDDAIQATQAVIDQTRNVKQGLLQQLLTRGIGHSRFMQTEIGAIPEAWSLQPLGQVAELGSGTTPSRKNSHFFSKETGIPWVKTLDLTDGLITSTEERLSSENLSKVRKPGTVLVAMYGGFNQIGRSGVLAMDAATNQAICCIELDLRRVNPTFCNLWLVGNRWRWKSVAASSRKDANITKDDVSNFLIALPPLDEQIAIANHLDAVSVGIASNEAKLRELHAIKRGLLSDLLSGHKRVGVSA